MKFDVFNMLYCIHVFFFGWLVVFYVAWTARSFRDGHTCIHIHIS